MHPTIFRVVSRNVWDERCGTVVSCKEFSIYVSVLLMRLYVMTRTDSSSMIFAEVMMN